MELTKETVVSVRLSIAEALALRDELDDVSMEGLPVLRGISIAINEALS